MSAALESAAPLSGPSRVVVIVGQGGVQTDLDLDSLADDEIADAIPDLLADYSAECKDWTVVAGEHWKQGRWSRAEQVLQSGVKFFNGGMGRPPDHMALANLRSMMAHLLLAQSRVAPKTILPQAKYDKVKPGTRTKDYYYTEATASLNAADEALRQSGAVDEEPVSLAMGKIILYLARGQPNIAHPLVERLLQRQPNNVIALTAQARLQFARRSHEAALQTYQKLLSLDPEMDPDPRIGLGLCAWVLGDKKRARMAWERSLKRDPSSWTSLLLLGLASLNTAREPSTSREERLKLEAEGVASVQQAFKLNNKSAAAALALSAVSGQGRQIPLASKLAERSIQYSDNKRHSIMANAERGRLGFMADDVADAGPYIAASKGDDAGGVNIMAELTLGQIAIKNGNLREALNFIEQTAKRLNGKGPLEYTVLHACLLAYPHPGMPQDELARNRATSRIMLSELHKLVASASSEEDWARLRGIGEDADIFIDLGRLWQDENLEKAIGAYQTAVTIVSDREAETDTKVVDHRSVRTSSNLGSLFLLQGNVDTAERMYQEGLEKIAADSGQDAEVLKTELAFNLARAYEEGSEIVKASQWYRDVLRQHPEHMDSKVRLAMLAAAAGRNVDAHNLLKECLKADESNVTLRSVYTHFLISIGSYREALAFTGLTLRIDKSDVYTFCALGWLHFTLGREAKSSAEIAERPKQYLRSAEAYERALVLDPKCAVAAQGLAIALAEDTLSQPGSLNDSDEGKHRMKLAGQALSIFSRINDSLPDGSVNVNMGHCFFIRGEEEKAIQAYEAALNNLKGRNASLLLYLARAWYAFANADSNFTAMSRALSYSQQAMHIQPSDRAILYNIAMIQQKSAELLFGLEPSKRTLEELKVAVSQAQQAANTFRALADDKSGALPYDVHLADQRARYGDGVLRRAPAEMARQEAYESEYQARVEEARKARMAEQERIQAAEAARHAEVEMKAAELAEQRRKAREEALAWQEELNARVAEEETRKAANADKRKRKVKDEIISGDEGSGTRTPAEGGKRKRKSTKASKQSRKVRSKSEIESDESEMVPSDVGDLQGDDEGEEGEEVDEATVKATRAKNTLAMLKARSKKKKPVADPDEEDEGSGLKASRGKQFKSKAYISESEDEGEGEGAGETEALAGEDVSDAEMEVAEDDKAGNDEDDD